jgi:glycosyltransferase involved in cell wall biosynthesis
LLDVGARHFLLTRACGAQGTPHGCRRGRRYLDGRALWLFRALYEPIVRIDVTHTTLPSQMSGATRRPLQIGCCAGLADPGWHWFADDLGPPLADWTFFSTRARSIWEKLITRPALSRYRACRELASGASSGEFDLIITHLPLVTCWTETFCGRRRKCPHVAFAFNFTDLPTGPRLALMRRAFGTLDRVIVFSSFEQALYGDYFRIPEKRIDVIPWRIQDPRAQRLRCGHESAGQESLLPTGTSGKISAVGSQGRDYATLFEAMRQLPHIPLVLVADVRNLQGLDPPPNVEVRQNIPLVEAEAVLRESRFVVVPLRDAQTACGHVTIVYSMFEERAVVATESAALAEYVIPGRNGILVKPRDARALARAIEDLWSNPEEARRLGAAGREFALNGCLESQTVDYVRRLVEQVKSTGKV